MKTNDKGLALIKSFESCKLKAYPDPATGGDPWTCGWGSTGPDIKKGTVWTQEQADARFLEDVNKFELKLKQLLKVVINENQFSALVSLAYNIGIGNLKGSTLLAKVNAKDFANAADRFLLWNKANGKEMAGLTRRRQAERALFLTA